MTLKRNTRTRFTRSLLAVALLASAFVALPGLGAVRKASALRSGPALAFFATQGTKVVLQGFNYTFATAANQQPPLSAFNVQVDGVRVDVASLDFSLPLFLDLILATPVYQTSTIASVTYTAPAVDNTLNNAALQDTNGQDSASFTFSLSTSNAGIRLSATSALTVVAGIESATIAVTQPTSGPTPSSYIVTSSPGGKTCIVTGASGECTISELTAGVSYTFSAVAKRNGMADSAASPASASVTALSKKKVPSWDTEPETDSEFDTNTEGFFPNPIPGNSIITDEFGFVIDKKGGIKPKLRAKNYSGKIKMSISATYKDAGKSKKYSCTFKPFGSTKKVTSTKWRWYTPKKACVLPKALITAVQKGETTISAKGKWTRQWLTSGKKARPDKTKITPRTLKYTMRARPAVA